LDPPPETDNDDYNPFRDILSIAIGFAFIATVTTW
jgi:hypothetical protein